MASNVKLNTTTVSFLYGCSVKLLPTTAVFSTNRGTIVGLRFLPAGQLRSRDTALAF